RAEGAAQLPPPPDSFEYTREAKAAGVITQDSYLPPAACLCPEYSAARCPPACRPYRVAILGDSIAASCDFLLPRIIHDRLAPHAVEVFASGRVGDSAGKVMGLAPHRGSRRDLLEEYLRRGCDELVVALGVNAVADGRKANELVSEIASMCERAMDAGVSRIVIVEIAPWGGHARWTPEKQAETLRYNRMLGGLAAMLNFDYTVRGCETEVEVARIYEALEDRRSPGRLRYPRRTGARLDPLHPSEAGIRVMAEEMLRQAYRNIR
ncbi:MAG: hypothetical protein JXA24_00785, partial [Proteobacteria bacterium]|nr:hypothetical protein [Pseudomonadota bacterium]